MNLEELQELGSELIDDLCEALSDYEFIDIEGDGVESDRLTNTAMYLINIEWDWDDFYGDDDSDDSQEEFGEYGPGDQLTDEIVSILDGLRENWGYEITYDWEDSSTIVVALHVDDYKFEDDEDDEDDDEDEDEDEDEDDEDDID